MAISVVTGRGREKISPEKMAKMIANPIIAATLGHIAAEAHRREAAWKASHPGMPPTRHGVTCPVCGRSRVNLYLHDRTWKCRRCWDAEKPSIKDMAEKVWEAERQCDACTYQSDGCGGGVHGGPNGPIYPPCAERDPEDYMDIDLLEEVYNEIIEEA